MFQFKIFNSGLLGLVDEQLILLTLIVAFFKIIDCLNTKDYSRLSRNL